MKPLEQLGKRKKYLIWPILLAMVFFAMKMTILAPPQVETVHLEKHDLVAQVYGNGTVEAKVVVPVSSKITGRIVALYADQGDHVKQGQLLARLENDDFRQQEAQSRAGVEKASAQVAVETATLRKARTNLELAEKNAHRYRVLADKNLVSRLEAEQYENNYQVAREEVARSQAALESANREQQAGKAGLGVARSRVADTLIYAPQDGIIIARDLEQGATITPGLAMFRMVDPRTVWVKANVDESLLRGITVGKEALITLRSAAGESLPGKVARLGRESDRVTEELTVEVAFVTPRKDFHLGEQADIYISSASRNAVPALPSAALITMGKDRGVWVVENGRINFRKITVGIEDRRGFTEVIAGLTANDKIIQASPELLQKLKNGTKVRVRS